MRELEGAGVVRGGNCIISIVDRKLCVVNGGFITKCTPTLALSHFSTLELLNTVHIVRGFRTKRAL